MRPPAGDRRDGADPRGMHRVVSRVHHEESLHEGYLPAGVYSSQAVQGR